MTITVDPSRDALVIVDVQNDFCPGGSLAVPDGDQVVPVLNRYIQLFAALKAPIFASRDWHPPVTKHFKAYGGIWPPHCVQGTRGAEFSPDLRLPPETTVVSKGTDPDEDAYSCSQARDPEGTSFATALGRLGVRRLFVGGLATDYCVKATTLDALREGFQVVVLEDAIRAVELHPGDGAKAREEMNAAGAQEARLSEF
ncbi:MAG: nicotinamidase [Candidatus Methylomirabilia bacterium]